MTRCPTSRHVVLLAGLGVQANHPPIHLLDPAHLPCIAALCSALGPLALRLGYIVNIGDALAELFGVLQLVAALGAGPPGLPADLLGG